VRPRRETHKKESPIKLLLTTGKVITTIVGTLQSIEWLVNFIRQLFK